MTAKNGRHGPAKNLPSYKKPPVNEVVCGLRFQTPDKLRIPHFGIFWDKIRKEYPNAHHASPIASLKGEIPIDVSTGFPLPRIWLVNQSDDQLIQFQIDRFYFNWRRRQGDYPRYHGVMKNFEKALGTARSFFQESDFGDIKPVEYELSYVNHIPKGEGWDTIDDLSNLFVDFRWNRRDDRFLPLPSTFVWSAEFALPEGLGKLAIHLKHAVRNIDKVPLVLLEFKANGIDVPADIGAMRKWFDVAHEWIVRGFTDMTTPESHKVWGREQ